MTKIEYDCFKIYLSIKLYFENKYDIFKYGIGKVKISPQMYDQRKDKFFFQKLSKKYSKTEDLIDFLVANFVYKESTKWIGDLFSKESEDCYFAYKSNHENIGYNFDNDCSLLLNVLIEKNLNFIDLFTIQKELSCPPILGIDLKIESLVILNQLCRFRYFGESRTPFEVISKSPQISPLWDEYERPLLEKYTSFVNYNRPKMYSLITKYLIEE